MQGSLPPHVQPFEITHRIYVCEMILILRVD
ncbi:hypothetical protein ED21_21649 [Erythrobacter sp. SD-21]|nr:hypothetical protein ED21_21649 [Erythrobacter sp. SD-21]